jgi:hypothetical protein
VSPRKTSQDRNWFQLIQDLLSTHGPHTGWRKDDILKTMVKRMAAGVNETHVSCAEHNFVYKKILFSSEFHSILIFIAVFLSLSAPPHVIHVYIQIITYVTREMTLFSDNSYLKNYSFWFKLLSLFSYMPVTSYITAHLDINIAPITDIVFRRTCPGRKQATMSITGTLHKTN